MSSEFKALYWKFARMFSSVRKAMDGHRPPTNVEDLISFLEDNSNLKADLANVSTLKCVMDIVRNNCTLIDIVILEAVVEYVEISEAQKSIDDYKQVIDEACQHFSVKLCLNETFEVVKTKPPLKCETITFIFDWDPDEYMLKDIKDILSKTTGKQVKILNVKKGNSIIVTCSFPHFLAGVVIMEVIDNRDMLVKSGLTKVTVGYCIIFEKQVCDHLLVI